VLYAYNDDDGKRLVQNFIKTYQNAELGNTKKRNIFSSLKKNKRKKLSYFSQPSRQRRRNKEYSRSFRTKKLGSQNTSAHWTFVS